tara:strand:+ start:5822 stop:6127 length:306 start_codon:yes stop_codon:yes gene_type:complete
MTDSLGIEKESLPAHVELCSERYEHLKDNVEDINDKFLNVESRMASLEVMISDVRMLIMNRQESDAQARYSLTVKIGLAVITGLFSAVGFLTWYVISNLST